MREFDDRFCCESPKSIQCGEFWPQNPEIWPSGYLGSVGRPGMGPAWDPRPKCHPPPPLRRSRRQSLSFSPMMDFWPQVSSQTRSKFKKKKQILWLSHQKCFQDFTIPSKGIDLGLQLFLSNLRGDHLAGPRSAGLPRRAAHQHRPGPSSSSRPRPVDSKQLLTSQGASRLEMAYLNSVAWHQILKTQKPSYGPQKKNTSRTRGLVYWTSSISPSQCLPTYIADDISTCLMVTLTPWTNSYVYILYTCWWLPPYHHRFISSWWNMSHPRCSYGFVWRMVPLISQLICRFGAIPNIPNSQTPSFHKISNITKLLLVIIPVISGYISYPLVI